jgi:hypothetical protein
MARRTEIVSDKCFERAIGFEWTERAFELLGTGELRAEIQEHRAGGRWAHVWGRGEGVRGQPH